MKETIANTINTALGLTPKAPRPVSTIVVDLAEIADELKQSSQFHSKRESELIAQAHAARAEAERASRVHGKIADLIS